MSEGLLAPDYMTKGGKYLLPEIELKTLPDGTKQLRIVEIEMTGTTSGDFRYANQKAGFAEFGKDGPTINHIDYTWNHLDDFRIDLNTGKSYCTGQLVRSDAHTGISGMGHSGGAAQYRAFWGKDY